MNEVIRQRVRDGFVHNPEYENAPFELAGVNDSGEPIRDMYPMRFRKEDVAKAIQLMQERKWVELRLLSVSPHRPE